MAFTNSPLFQEAGRQIQMAARAQFRKTDMGRLLSEVERARHTPDVARTVRNALQRFRAGTRPDAVLKQLGGNEFGGMVRTLQRYAQGSNASSKAVTEFLGSLGPAGKLIQSLISPAKAATLQGELQAAMELIRAFGGEVMSGKGPQWGSSSLKDVERGMQAAMKRLQEYGFEVVGSQGPPRRMPPEEGVDVEMGWRSNNEKRSFSHISADDPMLTGEMVPTPASKEVYEFGYDIESHYLYVRFRTHSRDRDAQGGPGPLYRYSSVSPEEFQALYRTRNTGSAYGASAYGPGDWIWDVLRIRGTESGHRKDYELVGIMGGYVPRKATVMPRYQTVGKRGKPLKTPKRDGVEEWYVSRTVKTHEGRWVRSVLPTAKVLPVRGGMHNR
jgi:hypothetical protein